MGPPAAASWLEAGEAGGTGIHIGVDAAGLEGDQLDVLASCWDNELLALCICEIMVSIAVNWRV